MQSPTTPRRINVFFYGSFIRPDVMARGGLQPETVDVARLSGFDIRIDPHASISRSDRHAIYGILVQATHEELNRLYGRDGVGVFLPEAVIVETAGRRLQPAICYISPAHGGQPADIDYLDRLLAAAADYGFPQWYRDHLASFRTPAAAR
ncbi:gamma-glutamylcyclotransferase [Aquincola sp. S2]|uniref:Gamma-glutamylcyclotransferase n=1 Tax=Pseudaquabacterium terrae TaxID=2732868 RepID=A0ABX2ENJ7_9BURK|nr:gamma-glutamylcyclotransferase family protein [Aquabacterium terrae]NRF70275.1 gamma-glutamylcyclotransferase [Aquabacterium terrae]